MNRFHLSLRLSLAFALFSIAISSSAQVAISTQNSAPTPDPTAVLLLVGNGSQGLIIPTITNIATSVAGTAGMVAYSAGKVYYSDGNNWTALGGGGGININGNVITVGSASVNLAQGFSGSANGFLFWNGTAWQQAQFTLPTSTQALVYNPATSSWGFQSISGGGGISTINKGGGGNFISITNPTGPIATINAEAIVDGDISGTANISGTKLQDGTLPVSKLSTGTATNGQFLRFNSGSWAPATIAIPASVTNVTATAPLASSGGTTPNISLSGTLPVANGGTGRTTWNGVLWGDGAGAINDIGNGTNGQVFTMQGTSPGWSPAPSSFTTPNVVPKGSAGGLVASGIFEDAAGNVGIGTTTPAYPLDIKTPNALSAYGLNHSDGTIKMSTYVGNGGPTGGSIGTQSDHPFFIYTNNGGARMTILGDNGGVNTGGVGIGTFTPVNKLDVAGGMAIGSSFAGASVSPANGLVVQGNVGVGTSTPSQPLEVNGNIKTSGYYYFNGTSASNGVYQQYIGHVSGTYVFITDHFIPNIGNQQDLGTSSFRWRTLYTNNTVNVSDFRLKKNIAPLRYGLNEVLNMRPVSYIMKDDNEEEVKLGLIAQEVRNLVPEVVSEEKNSKEKYLGMNYTELIPVLIKATQEQQTIIETQQSEINNLKKELDQVKNYLGMEAKAAKKKKSKK